MKTETKKMRLLKLVFAAMFAALICVATMVIQIPSPMNGYVNFGDCFILVAAWVLGPVYGARSSFTTFTSTCRIIGEAAR